MSKIDDVINWCEQQTQPFTYQRAADVLHVSYSTARRGVDRWAIQKRTYWAWGVWGDRNYYKIFAPAETSEEVYREWLRRINRSGRTRAILHRASERYGVIGRK